MNFSANEPLEDSEFDINITPLIDIVFLLLIFFMLSTSFVTSASINVNLPKSAEKASVKDAENLSISIDRKGQSYFGKTPVDLATIKERFSAFVGSHPNSLLIISADKAASHGQVVEIMDLAKTQGISRIAVSTQADS